MINVQRVFLGGMLLGLCVAGGLILNSEISHADDIKGIFINKDGNVGVGTNTPTHALHVKGEMLTEGKISGQGVGGRYQNSVVLGGYNTLGKPASFVLSFDEATYGPKPNAIQILNADANVFKTFIIDHPEKIDRYLVHATLEGPEGAVFYRGSSRLKNGRANISLPDYFEALTKTEGRTIQLTNVGGFDPLAIELSDGARIQNGKFSVVSNQPKSNQQFDWEVKAIRKDKADLVVEPRRSDIRVSGFGPYKVGHLTPQEE
jgi:hypothetical protein